MPAASQGPCIVENLKDTKMDGCKKIKLLVGHDKKYMRAKITLSNSKKLINCTLSQLRQDKDHLLTKQKTI